MFFKNKIRLLILIILLTISPIFECKQMHLVNTTAIVNTMVETARIVQAIAAYFILKYKNDVAVQQIKSIEQNDQKSYQRLINAHKNLVDNIAGIENISTMRLRYIEIPESVKQIDSVDSEYISDPTCHDNALGFTQNRVESSRKHPAIASFTNKMSELKTDVKQNKMFELIAKNVHKIVEHDLFPVIIPFQQIKDFTVQCIKQMGDYGSGAYVGVREHADRTFSKFAESIWAQEDIASLITKRKMEAIPEYKQNIENRLEGISKVLIASNSPTTRLTDRIKCRLLL